MKEIFIPSFLILPYFKKLTLYLFAPPKIKELFDKKCLIFFTVFLIF